MNIIAIGGGELRERQTLPLDCLVVEQTGKRSPKALFIPTASGDAAGYCDTFDSIYGSVLGCRTSHLRILARREDREFAGEKILEADLIYVGGGNSLRMMKAWRRFGIDRLLKQAGGNGTILSGLSAGAVCWHQWGHSDSRSFSGRDSWSYIRVRGLGFRPGLYCPHLDGEQRTEPFRQMVAHHRVTGIACDNLAAIHYIGNRAVARTCSGKAFVHIFRPEGERVVVERYRDGEEVLVGIE